jgi:ribosomal protein S17E
MARIKSTLVKRTAEKLIEQHEFANNFEENKKILGETMPSKRMRNIIAGYIARLVRKDHTKQQA